MNLASSEALTSSSNEFKAWDTSGFMDTKVLKLSSVPYLGSTNKEETQKNKL